MAKLSVVLPKAFIGPWFASPAGRSGGEAAQEGAPPPSKHARSIAGEGSARHPGAVALGRCLSELWTQGTRMWN
jgi:hypothetical protein